jgi:hypothetical protein
MVPKGFIGGIESFLNKFVRTALDAAETVLADAVEGFEHLAGIDTPLFVYLVNAILFYAAGAFEAAFFPCNDSRPGDRLKPVRYLAGMDMIFGGHMITPLKPEAWGKVLPLELFEELPLPIRLP